MATSAELHKKRSFIHIQNRQRSLVCVGDELGFLRVVFFFESGAFLSTISVVRISDAWLSEEKSAHEKSGG